MSPKDTLITSCVDSSGYASDGRRLTTCDNPLTGPFYIDGAEPGDALIVTIDGLTPNRPYGYSDSPIVPHLLEPDMAALLPKRTSVKWIVDRANGHARPAPADGIKGVTGLEIPLRPMLGCLGVAPERRQRIWSGTSGRHGGNMDYPGIREGTRVSLPVFEPGALLSLGDGHAAQGAGEINGAGIEISMDVEITIDLVKAGTVIWPRGEDESCLWALGNARPLEKAMQHATSEMVRWLADEFGMPLEAASILLSQSAHYDIANATNPMFSVSCRLEKTGFLQSRRKRRTDRTS